MFVPLFSPPWRPNWQVPKICPTIFNNNRRKRESPRQDLISSREMLSSSKFAGKFFQPERASQAILCQLIANIYISLTGLICTTKCKQAFSGPLEGTEADCIRFGAFFKFPSPWALREALSGRNSIGASLLTRQGSQSDEQTHALTDGCPDARAAAYEEHCSECKSRSL